MATGKTNARWIRVSVNGQDISTDVTNVGSVGATYEESDTTGYSDGRKNVTLGHPEDVLEMSGHFSNTATTGSHTVLAPLNGVETGVTVNIDIGIRAAPTTGDPRWSQTYIVSSYQVNGSDATFSCRLVPPSSATTLAAWTTTP